MSKRPPRMRQPKSEVDIKKRDWLWANGATLCDKWLKFKFCTRPGCTHDHRDARPDEPRPMCWDHFVNKDRCRKGPQCPLSHDRDSLIGLVPDAYDYHRSSNSSSPVSSHESDDISRTATLPQKVHDTRSSPPGKPAPQDQVPEKPNARKARPDIETHVPKKPLESISTSESPPAVPSRRRNHPKNSGRDRKQLDVLQKPLQPSTFPGLSQSAKAGIKSGKSLETLIAGGHSAARAQPEFTAMPGGDSRNRIPRSGPSRDNTPSPDTSSVFTNPALHDESSSADSSGGVLLEPSLLDSAPPAFVTKASTSKKPAKATKQAPAKQREDLLAGGSSASVAPRAASPTDEKHPFHQQISQVHAAITFLSAPVEIKRKELDYPTPITEAVAAHTEFKSVVSVIHNPIPRRPNKQASEATNAEVSRRVPSADTTHKTPPTGPRATRPPERLPLPTIPEWELQRCFNCWDEGHFPEFCSKPRLSHPDREEKREALGVINRRWTENVVLALGGPKFSRDCTMKHWAFLRIWQPYTSEVSRRYVSPGPVLAPFQFRTPPPDLDIKTDTPVRNGLEPPPKCDGSSQTEETTHPRDQSVQTDPPSVAEPITPDTTPDTTPETTPDTTLDVVQQNPWLRGLPTPPANNGKSIITGPNYEECWLCGKFHSRFDPCEGASKSISEEPEWDEAKWAHERARINKLASLPRNNTLQRTPPKRWHTSKGPLLLQHSKLINTSTTTYRIEDEGTKEVVFDRDELTLLGKLDREARDFKKRFASSDEEWDGKVRNAEKSKKSKKSGTMSPLLRCPTEILECIFTYAADDGLYGTTVLVKDVIAGHDFKIEDELSSQIRRTRNLAGVARSCIRLRAIAQNIIYKVVCFDHFQTLRNFARTITRAPDLGKIVQVMRITMEQTSVPYRQYGAFRYQLAANKTVPTRNDFASLFVRVVESCPNLQILTAKMFGSLLGFGALRGRWSEMREICISDPASTGQVLNRMWNHLPNFPCLNKFKIVHSEMNDHMDFEGLEIPHFMAGEGLSSTFGHLNTLTLELAPEVSDILLFYLVRRMPVLTKLAIVNCKLITSGGLAKILGEIPNRLSTLIFWVWLNHDGTPTNRELTSTAGHLCRAIKQHGESLSVLNLKPYKLCEEMWQDSNFKNLHRCSIDMMKFLHCKKKGSRDEKAFEAAFQAAREEEKLPRLGEKAANFHLNTTGISFR